MLLCAVFKVESKQIDRAERCFGDIDIRDFSRIPYFVLELHRDLLSCSWGSLRRPIGIEMQIALLVGLPTELLQPDQKLCFPIISGFSSSVCFCWLRCYSRAERSF